MTDASLKPRPNNGKQRPIRGIQQSCLGAYIYHMSVYYNLCALLRLHSINATLNRATDLSINVLSIYIRLILGRKGDSEPARPRGYNAELVTVFYFVWVD
jgi:hypothetical protein